MLDANYVFLGPGSPTYAARNLEGTLALEYLLERHKAGAVLCFASAATLAVGAKVLPVYEIFKAGSELYWADGLNVFAAFGLELAIVPHWNNTDGGVHLDTSRCFMGQERMDQLRQLLPASTVLLGIDEHTALVFDFKVLVLALLFVAINLAYTFRFKTVPYLEILLNTITHPLRFAAGLWLAGSWEHWPLLATWTLAIFAITTLKRIKEIREAGAAVRPVLKHYDEATLKNLITASLVLLLGIWPFTRELDFVLAGVWFALTLVAVVGYFRSPLLKRLEEHLWR